MPKEIKSNRVSPYLSNPWLKGFRWVIRILGWVGLIAAFIPVERKESPTFIAVACIFLIALDFGLGMLADIEQHTYHTAQAMMDLAQRGKRQPVEAKLVDPAQTNQDRQGKPRRGEQATIAPVPPSFGP